MRVLIWHVHGSWMTSFVQGPDEYLVPVVPDRGPDGRGRARTYPWPATVRELAPSEIAAEGVDVVVLQRPQDERLLRTWTGLRAGRDVPAVYVEHNRRFDPAAPGPAGGQPVVGRCGWRSAGVGDAATLQSFDHLEGAVRGAGELRPGQPGGTLPAESGSDDWSRRPFPEPR